MHLPLPPPNLRAPSLRVSALLVLAMLGFGVLIGKAARSSGEELTASTREHVRVVVRPQPGAATTKSSTEAPPPSAEPSEPPESEPAPTPAPSTPAPATPTPATAPESGSKAKEPPQPKPAKTLPAIKHVWVIMLSEQPYAAAFGPESQARYLTRTLEPKGALLARYDATAHEALPNGVALLSGQGPTVETVSNCPTYTAIAPTGSGQHEQVLGAGCVYPAGTATLPAQLEAKRLGWRAYIGGIEEAGGAASACAHPALGASDPSAAAGAETGPYATYLNPVVYFASLTAAPGCAKHDVGLAQLKHDLSEQSLTPSFSYIAPSRCEDGNPSPCAPGKPAGLRPADAFLARVVPEILASKAYQRSGLLAITVDNAPATGVYADSSSCCGQPAYPNLPSSLGETPLGRPRGGGAVGALLLSPFIKGPETSQEAYNHYSLLATIEQLFGVKRLGYAALPAVKPVEPSLFTETPNSSS